MFNPISLLRNSRLYSFFFIYLFICTHTFANEKEPTPYDYEFAVCAIFQNEAPYLREWIEYHKILGAEHFYLYNNLSNDHYLEVLAPYIEEGVVELTEWRVPNFQYLGQKRAYMHAIDKTRGIVKWLAILDLDEYLVPKHHDTMQEFLAPFDVKGIGGIGINWQMFGTSHVEKVEEGELLTEKLILKAFADHHENQHIKSIVRPEFVVEPPHVHHFEYIPGYAQVNSLGEPFKGPFNPITIDSIQINHYWTKDEHFFYTVKVPRRLMWGESMEKIEQRRDCLNQVEDDTILRFVPLLKDKLFRK